MVKGKRMQTTWRLEWTWGEAGAVTLDALQSDTIASIPTPIVPSGNVKDVNAASGTLTLNAGTLDSNPNFLANPAAGSRGRLTLILENLT